MAYTAILTKQSVTLHDGIYTITIHCDVKQDGETVWEGTGSGRYNPATPNLNGPKASILAELGAKWDKWKSEQGVFGSAILDTEVAALQTTINTYINA